MATIVSRKVGVGYALLRQFSESIYFSDLFLSNFHLQSYRMRKRFSQRSGYCNTHSNSIGYSDTDSRCITNADSGFIAVSYTHTNPYADTCCRSANGLCGGD
jgi:hypothetical protein